MGVLFSIMQMLCNFDVVSGTRLDFLLPTYVPWQYPFWCCNVETTEVHSRPTTPWPPEVRPSKA